MTTEKKKTDRGRVRVSRSLPKIPRGIEVLIKKAAVDTDFRDVLLRERAPAAQRIGLMLNDSEASILNSIPEAQLASIIRNTRVSSRSKEAFLGYVAAVMLAALGCDAHSEEGERVVIQGIDPDTSYVEPKVADNIPTETGRLEGTVTDQKDKPIADADVWVTLKWIYLPGTQNKTQPDNVVIAGMIYDPGQKTVPSRDVEFETATDESGKFTFASLPVGVYFVGVASKGYLTQENAEVTVTKGGNTEITIEMIKAPHNQGKGGARPDLPHK